MYKLITVTALLSGVLLVAADGPSFNLVDQRQRARGGSPYNASHPDEVPFKGDPRNLDLAQIQYTQAPADAVAYALADLSAMNKGDQPFQRYVWIHDGSKKYGEINYTINTAWSRATPLVKTKLVAQGRLVRIDLRQLAPRADVEGKDFRDILQLWEKLAIEEPYFHITRTTDDAVPTNAKLIKDEKDPEGSVRFEHDGQLYFKSANGNAYIHKNNEWQATKLQFAKKEAVAVAAAHVGLETHVMLQGLTQSAAPVVRADWWIVKSLTTLDGGLYYDLVGIERKPAQGTARDAFFKKVGVDVKEIEKLRSDQRTAMFKSKVTGRPRRVDYYQGIAVRPDSGSGLVIVTYDTSEEQVKAKNDPIRNLLEFEFAAQEIIAERPNGLHYYVLFAANGDLQDSAPDNVV
jgi:hypothetical protein